MTDIRMYLVGGAVRDELLGVKSKDLDYVAVVDPALGLTVDEAYAFMRQYLEDTGFTIFLEQPEYRTIRARFSGKGADTADFVLARKDGPYTDGRRPDWVEPGDLIDDIMRRDYTMNALAKNGKGEIVDFVGGVQDLADRRLRAVGDPLERLKEDALRAFRAIRFAVTKGFWIDGDLNSAMHTMSVLDALTDNISAERIKDELHRCFAFDTVKTITFLSRQYPEYLTIMQDKGIWLEPTMRGRK